MHFVNQMQMDLESEHEGGASRVGPWLQTPDKELSALKCGPKRILRTLRDVCLDTGPVVCAFAAAARQGMQRHVLDALERFASPGRGCAPSA